MASMAEIACLCSKGSSVVAKKTSPCPRSQQSQFPAKSLSAPSRSFYRRQLPSPPAVAFSSDAGRRMFGEALRSGSMEGYFALAEQFRTQDEPAFCGISTLTMVLNALSIDPGRIWKGPWRWFHEEMLSCCESLDIVKEKGIVFEKAACLARCNGADVDSFLAQNSSEEVFRERLLRATTSRDECLIVSYSRKEFRQTGDGHFSPIGGYHAEEDMALIMDVARFKYPPHWVSVSMLWKAMLREDKTTSKSRGFMTLRRSSQPASLLFVLRSHQGRGSWESIRRFFCDVAGRVSCGSCCGPKEPIECFFSCMTPDVAQSITTYISEFQQSGIPDEYACVTNQLLSEIRETRAFSIVQQCLKSLKDKGDPCPFVEGPLATELATIFFLVAPVSTWPETVSSEIDSFRQISGLLAEEIASLKRQLNVILRVEGVDVECECKE
eukprot:166594_1